MQVQVHISICVVYPSPYFNKDYDRITSNQTETEMRIR